MNYSPRCQYSKYEQAVKKKKKALLANNSHYYHDNLGNDIYPYGMNYM